MPKQTASNAMNLTTLMSTKETGLGCSKAWLCLLGWADGERRAVKKSANNKAGFKTAFLDFNRADSFPFIDFISVAYLSGPSVPEAFSQPIQLGLITGY